MLSSYKESKPVTYTLYKITHRDSGRAYVGMTKWNVDQRWKLHVSAAQLAASVMGQAILEYGEEAFSREELEFVGEKSEAIERERALILFHETLSPGGFNAVCIGETRKPPSVPINFKMPAEFVRDFKMYAASHGMKLNEVFSMAFEAYRKANP